MKRAAVLALATLWLAAPASAERLVVSLSNHRVAITSSFTGEDLVLFGTIEPDTPRGALRDNYDIVVTVSGPRQTYRTRRKERVLGIWVNVDSRQFINVPSYLAVLANRPISEITSPEIARRQQLGLDNFILTQRVGADFADTVREDPFRVAFISLSALKDLYGEDHKAVTFLTPTVFRAAIPLPSETPTGTYAIDVKLFSGGQLITRANSALEINKAGFEQYVADAARNQGFLYGFATMLLALLTGWVASVVFRRD
ncbi:MAG: TIGR02186 family protein [Pseudolabrys sp.]|nr:TIGR02186 family protein [Pseudolabrys sp.]MBV9955832.1 TIGR02186 family protein [Pseudolabrys sp.]